MSSVVGILADDTDPMVSVMKVEKAPLESYADIGGLESQVQPTTQLFMIHLDLHNENIFYNMLNRYKRLRRPWSSL